MYEVSQPKNAQKANCGSFVFLSPSTPTQAASRTLCKIANWRGLGIKQPGMLPRDDLTGQEQVGWRNRWNPKSKCCSSEWTTGTQEEKMLGAALAESVW